MRLAKTLCCAAALTVMLAPGARADQWDKKKIYTTMLAVPNQRLEPSDKPIVLFSERASGSPQAVKVWFYPGETIGNEFVYPRSQAMKIAKDTHTRVLAMNN